MKRRPARASFRRSYCPVVEPLESRLLMANLAPIVHDDSYVAREGRTLTVVAADGVLANDVDPEKGRLTVKVVSDPEHGTIRLRPNGAFEYFHDGSAALTDQVQYQATDVHGATDTGTIDFTIRPVNDAPVAASDVYLVTTRKLTVAANEGLLVNDRDAEHDSLKARLVDNPGHGRVILKTNGSFIYAPDAGFQGTDHFTYRVNDGRTNSKIVRVNLVGPVQVADDADLRFLLVGQWVHHSLIGIQQGGRYRQAGNGTHQAIWTLDVVPGLYRVSATWSESANRATNAPFTISDGTTVRSTVRINQELRPNDFRDRSAKWKDLGDPVFVDGHTLVVRLTNDADQYVVADAIRIERLASPPIVRASGSSGQTFVTKDGKQGTWGTEVRHHYATDPPFNATGTLLWLENRGKGSALHGVVLDVSKANEIFTALDLPAGQSRWDPRPTHAYERIVVTGKKIVWVDVRTRQTVRSWNLPFARNDLTGKGNPSADGAYIPLLGDGKHAYILNIATGKSGPPIDLTKDCGLADCDPTSLRYSPNGKHLLVGYAGSNWRLLDVNRSTLKIAVHAMPGFPANCPDCSDGKASRGFLAPKLGHPDFVLGAHGETYVVGQSRTWRGKAVAGVDALSKDGRLGSVLALNVATHAYFSPTAYEVNGVREGFAHHISGKAYDRPGWVYVTYLGAPSEAGKRFAGEIVAIELTTGKVERLGTHRSTSQGCYRCEPHAVPSRDGRHVVFASTWGQDQTEVNAYVIAAD